jgi:hypothetical protein
VLAGGIVGAETRAEAGVEAGEIARAIAGAGVPLTLTSDTFIDQSQISDTFIEQLRLPTLLLESNFFIPGYRFRVVYGTIPTGESYVRSRD